MGVGRGWKNVGWRENKLLIWSRRRVSRAICALRCKRRLVMLFSARGTATGVPGLMLVISAVVRPIMHSLSAWSWRRDCPRLICWLRSWVIKSWYWGRRGQFSMYGGNGWNLGWSNVDNSMSGSPCCGRNVNVRDKVYNRRSGYWNTPNKSNWVIQRGSCFSKGPKTMFKFALPKCCLTKTNITRWMAWRCCC
jgi:hypothetical protein